MSVITSSLESRSPTSDYGEYPLVLVLGSTLDEMRARFDEFVLNNPDLCVEQLATGEVVIMSPAGGESSSRNSKISAQVSNWAETNGGITFDSSALFVLPNGAKRSPDTAWIERSRWMALSTEEREGFAPICPDFVVELRSKTDRLAILKKKMDEYLNNGVRLGWLIDPYARKVHIYRPGVACQILDNPSEVGGEDVLVGFKLDLQTIFSEA